jgi:signal transduction histidine kinase
MVTGARCAVLGLTTIALFVLAGCRQSFPSKTQPRAVRGVLDLSDWDFETNGPVDLAGEYEFYWKQHIQPEGREGRIPPVLSGYIEAPGSWNGYVVDGKKLSGDGYATYRLCVLLKKPSPLAFKFLDMGTAYAAYVNGKNLTTVGVPGTTPETTVPRYFSHVVDFAPEANRLELVFHFSNFHHRKGGMWKNIRLGLQRNVHRAREQALFFDLFLFGGILIMGLYHLGLFALRKTDTPSLYFGLFCCLIALRIIITVEMFLLYVFPEINWELLLKLEYLTYYVSTPVFAMFVHSLFSEDYSRTVLRIVQIVGFTFSGIVVFSSAKFYSHTALAYQLFTVLNCFYGLYVLILCAVRKREGSTVILAGFIIMSVTIINDILDYNQIVRTGRIFPFGLFLFIFSQAFLLSFRFSRAFTTIDLQRLELEKANLSYKNELLERMRAEETIRELEKQRIESEKLTATGRMAARIAHEINNPLGGIQTAFRLISRAVSSEHRYYHYVGKIEKEIERIAQIVRQMLDLYKPDTKSLQEFRADQIIGDVVTLLKPHMRENKIKFDLDLRQARETVALPENMLRQILYNLILNAVEASQQGGLIRITAKITDHCLHVAVSDCGEGIPEEIQSRIFEPFFTTKSNSAMGGMGLGLSICKSLVEATNGALEFTSRPGKGTEFRVSLPLQEKTNGG